VNQPLQIEYNFQEREEKFEFHHESSDVVLEGDNDEDAEVEQEEEKPKKKRGKKLRRKKAKKIEEDNGDEDDVVEEKNDQLIDSVAEQSGASALDDFLADLVNPKNSNANERSLVPASSSMLWENNTAEAAASPHGQLGWLSSSMTAPITNNELALFDTVETKPAPPVQRRSVPEAPLFAFPAPPQVGQPEYYNPYAARPAGPPAAAQGYYGYPPQPQPEPQWNQLMLEYPAPANVPKKQHEDAFNWMN